MKPDLRGGSVRRGAQAGGSSTTTCSNASDQLGLARERVVADQREAAGPLAQPASRRGTSAQTASTGASGGDRVGEHRQRALAAPVEDDACAGGWAARHGPRTRRRAALAGARRRTGIRLRARARRAPPPGNPPARRAPRSAPARTAARGGARAAARRAPFHTLRSSRKVASSRLARRRHGEAPVAAERDRARARAAGDDREARVAALPHRPQIAEAGAGHEQPRPGLPIPHGSSALELLGQREPELGARDDRVDPLDRLQQLRRQHARRRARSNRLAERGDAGRRSIVSPAAARWPP